MPHLILYDACIYSIPCKTIDLISKTHKQSKIPRSNKNEKRGVQSETDRHPQRMFIDINTTITQQNF